MSNTSQVLLLGIPFDNLTLKSSIEKIISMAGHIKKVGNAKLVTTVNVDFLTNALGWTWNQPSRHPELLDILRRSDMVTADGMPIVWLSKLIKHPLRSRVAGSDIVPALATAAAKSGHSLFLLGGQGYVAQKAAEKLQQQNPQLNIAGVYAPFVYSEGEKMLESEYYDEQIVDYINQCQPDILLIGFGNPKQELFFQRNQHRLKIGVAIGVGGTFEFITGRVARAPKWMQDSGLEWLFRISQDPGRLWKRYALGMLKLASISLPLILHNFITKLFSPREKQGSQSNAISIVDNTIHLPARLTNGTCDDWLEQESVHSIVQQNKKIVLDFHLVEEIDSSALAGLIRLLNYTQTKECTVHISNLVNLEVIRYLKVNHVWDIFSKTHLVPTVNTESKAIVMDRSESNFNITEASNNISIISLKGRLDANWINSMDDTDWLINLNDSHCILDLSQLQFVDSTGLRLFFKIKQQFSNTENKIVFAGTGKTIMQLFLVTKVDQLFHFCNDIAEAKNYLINS